VVETGAIAMTRLRQDRHVLHGIASPVLTVLSGGDLQMVNKKFDAAHVYARRAEPVRENVARYMDKCIAAAAAYHQISLRLLRNFLWKLYAHPVMRRFAGFRPSDDLAHAFPGVWLFVRCRYAFERAFVCFLGSFLLYLVFRLWRVLLLPFPFCDGLGRSGHCK
jgi:hypothetical protein